MSQKVESSVFNAETLIEMQLESTQSKGVTPSTIEGWADRAEQSNDFPAESVIEMLAELESPE